MSIVYYAKFNINSDLKKVKEENLIIDLLLELAYEMEARSNIYKYIYEYDYTIQEDRDGEEVETVITVQETYRFLDIKISGTGPLSVITGSLMREKPDKINIYNSEEHKITASGINKRAFSTQFIFDLSSETIVFTERNGLGRKQFIRAFEALAEEILTDYNIKIYLKEDPRGFAKKVKELTRVDEINIEIISPNFVDDDLDSLEKEAKKIGKKMDDQNITKMTYYLETSPKNKEGIDLKGSYAKEAFRNYSIMSTLGYSKGVVKGKIGNQTKNIRSQENAPFTTEIDQKERDNLTIFEQHAKSTISREATQRAVEAEKNRKGK